MRISGSCSAALVAACLLAVPCPAAVPGGNKPRPIVIEDAVTTELRKGDRLQDKGDHDGAIASYTRAIAMQPDSVMAYVDRGVSYGATERYDLAVRDFNKAIALDAKCAPAYFNRASAYSQQGQTNAALADYERAVKLKPDFSEALYNLAKLCEQMGKTSQAADCYRRFIKAAPPRYSNRVELAGAAILRLDKPAGK